MLSQGNETLLMAGGGGGGKNIGAPGGKN